MDGARFRAAGPVPEARPGLPFSATRGGAVQRGVAKARVHAFALLPLVLTVVVVLEELAIYKVREILPDPYVRAAVILAMFGVGFALAAGQLIPWMSQLLRAVHRSSAREGGVVGLLLFYGLAYAALYYALLIMETRGVQFLLPPNWR